MMWERPGFPGLSHASVDAFRLAAARRLAEARERVQVAHERVTTDVCRRALRRLRDRVRSGAGEPGEEDFVLWVPGAVVIGTRGARHELVGRERVGPDVEADTDDRVTGLEKRTAAVLGRRRRQPRVDSVVHEWVVTPLGDFVAQGVDVSDI